MIQQRMQEFATRVASEIRNLAQRIDGVEQKVGKGEERFARLLFVTQHPNVSWDGHSEKFEDDAHEVLFRLWRSEGEA